jgi:acyl carrier protein
VSTDLVSLVVQALQEVNQQQELQLNTQLDQDTALFGRNGILDSLGLVTLVIAVEQAITDQIGVHVSLADEKAMSQQHSPYRTIGSLAEYAGHVIQAEMTHG